MFIIFHENLLYYKLVFLLKDNLNTYELMDFDGTSLTLSENSLFNSGRTKTLFEVHDWGGWCHDSVTSRSFNRYVIITHQ